MKEKTILRKAKKQHEVIVSADNLTAKNLGPTAQELYALMHLTSCDHAIKRWKDHWMICPVCAQPAELIVDPSYGIIAQTMHRSRKEITN